MSVISPTPENTGPALVLRTAASADLTTVVTLVNSAYRGESARAGWTYEADLLGGQRVGADDIATALTDPRIRILLAEHGGEVVGCCKVCREDAGAYFGMFAVRPTRQGRGTGGWLLGEAERLARHDWGCAHLRMSVIAQRGELIAWYQRRGYRRNGVSEAFPYGDERFGIPKQAGLYFVELVKPLR